MRINFTFCLPALALVVSFPLFSQSSKDITVPLQATVLSGPTQILLNWASPTPTADVLLFKRSKDAGTWIALVDDPAYASVSFQDNNVAVGNTYEYGIQLTANGLTAFGYLTVPVEAPITDNRGTILVILEEALQAPLSAELERLEQDMVGDGWQVQWEVISANASVTEVKQLIVSAYNQQPTGLKQVLLFGNIPVPYSGNTSWDGHGDHQGAWPADTYYGEVNSTWQDQTVNNTTPSRPVNDNVPGDGKFDHSYIPSPTELAVGRVDFSNLDETTFGATHTELYRRYLDKNHRWRTKVYTVQEKALIDDNFGYFGGEAFAANGYRLGNALVGEANIMTGDFFNDTDEEGFLVGYGCGGGTYTSAGGVGTSTQFANDSVNVVFSMLFGSYHGDWDYSPNPFMPSALASKGGILSCSWAGRPHWFYHHLAAGETLGYCAVATQNACSNPGYYGTFGECGVHVALLGDPTLRAHIIAPAANLTASQECTNLLLQWEASASADVIGYHVYRADNMEGPFTRLTTDPVSGTSFLDSNPPSGDMVYQVKAVELHTSLSGSYFNTSTGIFVETSLFPATPLNLEFQSQQIDCNHATGTAAVESAATNPFYFWTGPNGFNSSSQQIQVDVQGSYAVTVTDISTGCVDSGTVVVNLDTLAPSINPSADGMITCTDESVDLSPNASGSNLTFSWSGPDGFTSTDPNPVVISGGIYTLQVTNTGNGCIAQATVDVVENTILPGVSLTANDITCVEPSAVVSVMMDMPTSEINWSGPNGFTATGDSIAVGVPGIYEVEVVGDNGCITVESIEVFSQMEEPGASANGGALTCTNNTVQLQGSSSTAGVLYEWTGPNGFVSNEQNPFVQIPGNYLLVVTNPSNGCSSLANASVIQSDDAPQASPSVSGMITCLQPEVTLMANPALPGMTFLWSGPNGFTTTVENPATSVPGLYQLILTDPAIGCSGFFEVQVDMVIIPTLNIDPPFLSCGTPTIILDLFQVCGLQWIDCTMTYPDSTIVEGEFFEIDQVGEYHLTIIDQIVGCPWDVAPFTVAGNFEIPNLVVSGDVDLPCAKITTVLEAESTFDNVVYTWTGANFSMPNNPVQELYPGSYLVTAETPYGCIASQEVVVTAPPSIEFQATFLPDCEGFFNMFDISISGGVPPYTYQISPVLPLPPNTSFTIVIEDANGCMKEVTSTTPAFEPMAANINSTDETVAGANDGTATVLVENGLAPFEYAWSNGATTPTVTDLSPGNYSVTVTSLVNGCQSVATVTIEAGVNSTAEVPGAVSLQISPNPSSGLFEVNLAAPGVGEAGIQLLDVTGKILTTVASTRATKWHWKMDLTSQPAGVYWVKIELDDQVLVRKIVKL